MTSSLDISWLYNTSTSTTYQWWHRLDYNSHGDNYQLYDKVSDDLQCPEGDWDVDGYAGSIEGRLTQWFSNSTYLGVKRVTWEKEERSLDVRRLTNQPWSGYEVWFTQDANHTV